VSWRFFPPVVPRSLLVATDYVQSFPNLLGVVSSFAGDERAHGELVARAHRGEEWAEALAPTSVALCSSACHPLYPSLPSEVPGDGLLFGLEGWCFRNEPSGEPTRLQAFRQAEYVAVGTPGMVVEAKVVVASDPFFGRGGRMLRANQLEAAGKHEVTVCVGGIDVAVTSVNDHHDHFGVAFGLRDATGATAVSACVGFGLERCTLALVETHGPVVAEWPSEVREALGLGPEVWA
jgi:seryl-tRNA synthetase